MTEIKWTEKNMERHAGGGIMNADQRCPFCETIEPSVMLKITQDTPELENGVSLTCPTCGFSLIAKNNATLTAAHNCLWEYAPEVG